MKIKVELGYCEWDKERVRDRGGKKSHSAPPLTLSFQFREQLSQGLQAWLYGMSTSTKDKTMKKKKRNIKRTITMNKTTYANFYGVVNVFLGGDCLSSALGRQQTSCCHRPSIFLFLSQLRCIKLFATWNGTSCPESFGSKIMT